MLGISSDCQKTWQDCPQARDMGPWPLDQHSIAVSNYQTDQAFRGPGLCQQMPGNESNQTISEDANEDL